MDYNINFKYKPEKTTAPKGAKPPVSDSGIKPITESREKAIQAGKGVKDVIKPDEMSKKGIENLNKTMSGLGGEIKKSTAAEKKGVTKTLKPDNLKNKTKTKSDDISKKDIDTNTKLNTNILKLNQSITLLTSAVKKSGGGTPSFGGSGGGTPSFGGGSGKDTSAGFGGMGASIPIAGAAIALTGFIIQKVNQIGNAYIEKTSQQAKSVGVGGFRYGEGMYNAAEMGAGMKAFGMSTGKFSTKAKTPQAAIRMGNIFGLSAEEALGQAGTFKRTGASIEKALYTGAGAGLETELPKLIQAMSSTLEEAVKNGVNTSDLAKDLGDDLTALTMATTTKSVEAAMKISRAGDVSKTKTEQGQIQNIEDLFLWKGAQEELLKSLNEITVNPLTGKSKREETLAYMQDRGFVNAEQKSALERTEKITEKDIRKVGGEELLNIATEDKISSMSGAKAARIIAGEYKKGGMSQNQAVMVSQAIGGMGKSLIPATLAEDIDLSETRKKGEEIITRKSAEVTGGISGIGVGFERTKEDDILTYGYDFAQATVEMDKAMRTLAKEGIGMATSGIKAMGDMAMAAADGIKSMSNEIDKIKKQGLSKTLKNMFFD